MGAGLGAETCAPVAGGWVRVELDGFLPEFNVSKTPSEVAI